MNLKVTHLNDNLPHFPLLARARLSLPMARAQLSALLAPWRRGSQLSSLASRVSLDSNDSHNYLGASGSPYSVGSYSTLSALATPTALGSLSDSLQ